MSQVLYRKYRSSKFNEIIGQEHITNILREAVRTGTVSHSYLFFGPRGTGKTSTARILAKALNCKHPLNGEPCDECSSCKAINEGKFLDLLEIDAASNRGIDQIRQLRERVNFAPVEGKYKVYIIDEVHMLTNEAFNALLKTLEEPPKHTIFILATTEVNKVPATIISRCQRFDFKLGTNASIAKKLRKIASAERIEVEDEALDMIINAARGSFRDAETIFEKVITDETINKDNYISVKEVRNILGLIDEELIDKLMTSLVGGDIKSAVEVVDKVSSEGKDIFQFCVQVIEVARAQINKKLIDGEDDYGLSLSEYSRIIKLFSRARIEIRNAVIPQVPIEIAIIDFVGDRSENSDRSEVGNIQSWVKEVKKKIKSSNKPESVKSRKQNDAEEKQKEVKSQDIKNKWNEHLKEVKPFNHNLAAFLMLAEFDSVEGDEVVIRVPYVIHKKKIEQKRSRDVFQGTTRKIWGRSLYFSCIVDDSLREKRRKEIEEKEDSEDNMLNQVKELFGDTIVEEL